MSDRLAGEVDSVSDNVVKLGEFVEKAEKVIAFAKKICQVKTIITSILGALEGILGMLATAHSGLSAVTPPGTATEIIGLPYASICGGKTALAASFDRGLGVLEKICGFVNCHVSSEQPIDGFRWKDMSKGVPWCRDIQKIYSNVLTGDREDNRFSDWMADNPKLSKEATAAVGGFPGSNVKDSIIWSSICLCLPGIVHNIKKYTEIQCKYGNCLLTDVAQNGMPIGLCKGEKGYDECALIIGQIFNALPLANLERYIDQFMEMLANWEGMVVAILFEGVCVAVCARVKIDPTTLSAWQYLACAVPRTLEKIMDAYASTAAILDSDYWDTSSLNYCEEFKKAKKEAEG